MRRKRLLIILSAIMVLVVAGLGVLPLLVDARRIRDLVVSQLESSLQRRVSVQSADLTVFTGLGLRLRQAVVFEDPRFGPIPMAKIASLQVRLKLFSLLTGKVEVGSIHVSRPEINLVKNATGVWNIESLGRSSTEKPVGPTTVPGAASGTGAALVISELHLRDGVLLIRDETESPAPRTTRYEGIDLDLANFSVTNPGTFALQVQLPGSGRNRVKAQGEFGPITFANLSKTAIDGRIEFSDTPLA